jgi:quercetin dioxygenase-like cupin family protein
VDSWDIRSLDVEPHRPQVLRTDGEARVIAINLPDGEELQEHQTHERAYLMVADGEVEIANGGETTSGGPGFVAHFAPNERREVRAKGGARLVLFLGPWPGEGHPNNR